MYGPHPESPLSTAKEREERERERELRMTDFGNYRWPGEWRVFPMEMDYGSARRVDGRDFRARWSMDL